MWLIGGVLGVLIGCQEAQGDPLTDKELLVHIHHESGGNDWAIGDHNLDNKAYGPLQIRQPFVDDVNKLYKTRYRAEDCWGNRALSIAIAKKYWAIHLTKKKLGREPTALDRAGTLNGGPIGYKRAATLKYRREFVAIQKCQKVGEPLKKWRAFLR
jgi:hypothetical protein